MKLFVSIGLLAFALSANAGLFTFDSGVVTLNDSSPASPDPVVFNVSGLDGVVTNVGLYFNGMNHTFPDDLAAVLFSSSGTSTLLFDGPGDNFESPTSSWDWKFDESISSTQLSNNGSNATGFYAAGQNEWNSVFTSAPAGPYGSSLLNYNGLSAAAASGNWSLFIEDFIPGDEGTVRNIQLRITTESVPEPASLAVLGLGAIALLRRRKNRN